MVHQTLSERQDPRLRSTHAPDERPIISDPREAEIVRLVCRARPHASVAEVLSLSQFEWPDDLEYSLWLHTAPPAEVAGMIISTLKHLHKTTPPVHRRAYRTPAWSRGTV